MTMEAVHAVRADSDALAAIAATFDDDQWATPSGCAGWSVQDVFTHLDNLFLLVTDPGALPRTDPSAGLERTQDELVARRRGQSSAQVLEAYRRNASAALTVLGGMQGVETPVDLGDLGKHPAHLIANAFAFDHYTHIRADLLAPLGPLHADAPEADETRIGAALDWMVAGAPQMNAADLATVGGPIAVVLTGPGARTVQLLGEGDPIATVTSSAADFVLWGTRRRPWREMDVRIDGNLAAASAFCDALHVF